MNIQGQAALVTGGGSGLGEATARELARLGAKVAILDVNLAGAQAVVTDIGGVALQCDVTSPESVQAAIAAAASMPSPAPPYCSGISTDRKPARVSVATNSLG